MLAKKSYSGVRKSYSHQLTGVDKIILPLLTIMLLGISTVNYASALTYQDAVDLQFTWNPTLNISLSSADLIINNLTPGTSADSNIITINVATNNASGYVLTATTGNTSNASTNLVNTTDNTKLFTSLATTDSLATLTADNTWGYSFSTNSGTSWSNYSGLPLYTATSGAELVNNNGSGSTPVQFKIAAKASNMQASGAYTNVINFTAVANPEPTPVPITCGAGKICYSANALNSEGSMGEQTTDDEDNALSNGSSVTLLASNYSRNGYGFVGWSPTMDGTGIIYGPNETITTSDLSENGLALYAIWVASAGSMQDTSAVATACNSLTQAPTSGSATLASVSALTDSRDNQTYAIAKLADGNCWMVENLRLESIHSTGSKASLAQGYATSNDYGNFIGLADAESTGFYATYIANSLYYSGTQEGTAIIDIGTADNPGYRMPRYNNDNTSNRANSPSTNTDQNIYSYGNYYSWHAAIADLSPQNTENASVVNTSLCPTGWHLPTGGKAYPSDDTGGINVTGDPTTFREAYDLAYRLMGSSTTAYESSVSDNQSYYTSTTVNQNNDTASKAMRKYPYNLVYAGSARQYSVISRGNGGYYWTSTASTSATSSLYYMSRASFYPGTLNGNKYWGYTVRCMRSLD